MVSRPKKKPAIEIYQLKRSPLAQRLTKKKFAELVRVELHELHGLIRFKRSFITSKDIEENGKVRPLRYPTGRLRLVNEKINYQLRKIKLPAYVMSPRKGRGQKQNAAEHVDARQVLKLDLRKFYPSTTRTMIAKYFRDSFQMHADVAGLITELLTFEGTILYGAPATPTLAMLVHQAMFDEIDRVCRAHSATFTLWVDNLTISGDSVPGELLKDVRRIIASRGLKSHDIGYFQSNKFVPITGINVKAGSLHPANSTNIAVRQLEAELRSASTADDYQYISNNLLSRLGGQLFVLDSNSERGRRVANRMNAVRQKRDKILRAQR